MSRESTHRGSRHCPRSHMSSRLPSTLLDSSLAPATRLMARLRFSQKALVIGAVFMMTCGVMTGLLMTRTTAANNAATHQHDAVEGLLSLHHQRPERTEKKKVGS